MSFLKYTGKIDYNENNKIYSFEMEDETELTDKIYMNIPKPITDTNFKQVFGQNSEIAKSLLNSFLFPKTRKIKSVEYISGELSGKIGVFPEPVNTNDFDSLRVDILSRCILDEKNISEKNEKYSNTYVIDLEMQNGFSIENTKRFLNYAKRLDLKYKDRVIVLSLVSKGRLNPIKNNSSMISLQEKSLFDFKKVYEYDDYVIYQIDLDYCRKIISNNDLWITDKEEKLNDCTKEWIKYLTLSTWCRSYTQNYYALPTVRKEFFDNNYVYEAITILCNQDDVSYQMDLYDQEVKEDKIKQFNEQKKIIKKQEEELKAKDKENNELKKKIKKLESQIAPKKKKISKKVRKTKIQYPKRKSNSSDSSNSNHSGSFNK